MVLILCALLTPPTHANIALTDIKLAEPSKTAYRCGNAYTDNEEDAQARGCRLVSADPTALDLLNRNGNYREIAANKNLKIFVDKSTATKEGLFLKAWSILSYHKPQALGNTASYQSVQSLEYYDCAARTSATKRQVYYQDKVPQGPVVDSIELAFKFEQDPPLSMGERVIQYLCDR